MVARQNHGFIYENTVVDKYGLIKLENSSVFDAMYKDTPVQIKCIKKNSSVCLGSLLNNKNINRDFILVVGYWETIKTDVVEEITYYIKYETYSQFFKFQDLDNMFLEMESISNNVSDDDVWKLFAKKYKALWGVNNPVSINFKRDHKTQKRVQCSISQRNINKFLNNFKKFNFEYIRNPNKDQFFTDPKVAEYLVSKIENIEGFDIIIEPSAGCGSFLKYLPSKTISYDIEPKMDGIITVDYLTTNTIPGDVLVVGNPPFGRQSSLAKKFIKHSCKFADTIAFILPKSFKKESMKRAFDLYFHLIHQEDIKLDSFFFQNNRFKVPCVFQIWKRTLFKREKYKVFTENEYYSCVKKHEAHDLAFRRVGINAGKFNQQTINLSEQSHIFLKFHKAFDYQLLNNIKFEDDNTVGPKSISKNELIEKLNGLEW
jgi:predicted RNA methylase